MKVSVIAGVIFFSFLLPELAFSHCGYLHLVEAEELSSSDSEDKIYVGNTICPVSGEEINFEEMEPFYVEYEGKIYNLCCKMCAKDFKKDPQKYIEKLKELEDKPEHSEHHHRH